MLAGRQIFNASDELRNTTADALVMSLSESVSMTKVYVVLKLFGSSNQYVGLKTVIEALQVRNGRWG